MNSKYLPLLATIVIFVLSYVAFALQYPNMLSTRVAGNLLTDNAFLGIAAVGMTFVIISGGIDLSIGSVIAFTGVFLAVILRDTSIHPLVAFALVLIITTSFGGLMGAVIHYLEDAGIHRHVGRHVPGPWHVLCAFDRQHSHQPRILFDPERHLLPPAGRRTADADRRHHAALSLSQASSSRIAPASEQMSTRSAAAFRRPS